MQERRNSSALAIELRLSCTNPSISSMLVEPCYAEFIFGIINIVNTLATDLDSTRSYAIRSHGVDLVFTDDFFLVFLDN